MRKILCAFGFLLLSGILAAPAAELDGRWVVKIQKRKGTQEMVLNLKSDGDRLTGTVSTGKRGRGVEISDGRIDGDQVSFVTATKGGKKKNRQAKKMLWSGKAAGGELKGVRQAEGRRRGQSFTAVRQ